MLTLAHGQSDILFISPSLFTIKHCVYSEKFFSLPLLVQWGWFTKVLVPRLLDDVWLNKQPDFCNKLLSPHLEEEKSSSSVKYSNVVNVSDQSVEKCQCLLQMFWSQLQTRYVSWLQYARQQIMVPKWNLCPYLKLRKDCTSKIRIKQMKQKTQTTCKQR